MGCDSCRGCDVLNELGVEGVVRGPAHRHNVGSGAPKSHPRSILSFESHRDATNPPKESQTAFGSHMPNAQTALCAHQHILHRVR